MLPSIMCRGMQQALQGITVSTLRLVTLDPSWGRPLTVRWSGHLASWPASPVQQPLEGHVLKEPHIMS